MRASATAPAGARVHGAFSVFHSGISPLVIRIDQLVLQRGTKVLFDHTSVTLNPGERVGLVGANGSGKSTLFALLRGELHPDGGDVSVPAQWRIAHVAQETPAVSRTAVDYVIDGDTRLREIEAAIAAAQASGDGSAEGEAHAAYADADGYTAPARAEALLLGLGFTLAQVSQPVASFSGGWRMRLNLAQALMCPSDLLLLDEPTNHLDLDAIVWLEDWLARYPGTLVMISHDREFLDAICNVTVHIENQQLRRYGGNYTLFETLRLQQMAQQQAAYARQQKEIAHLESFITRFKAKATKARQAQSRVKALEKMERLAPVHVAAGFAFEFREPDAAPNPMMVLDGVDCGYAEADPPVTILHNLALSIQNGQRIGLLGANGQGKSTLVKTLAGTQDPLKGTLRLGKGLQIGYFAQHQLETLRDHDSALQHLARLAPDVREQELRDFLGSFNFRGDMATTPIEPFSGGEKARLALALIVWQKPNLLLLDEPTNHLDLDTREALTMALAQFEGTLILVSHDRHLLRATADQFMLVADGTIRPFDGDLDDYRDWLLQQAAAKRNAATAAHQAESAGEAAVNRKDQRRAEADERQRLSALRKPLTKELEKVEKRMAVLQSAKAEIDQFMADEGSYAEANKMKLMEMLKRQGEVNGELETLEEKWLELQEQIEQIA
ncbi:fused putative transporter subunits of ABC superfamily: ATP-binding components [Cupriavidus taiwanensis]|uniref:Probable ATP-binding protein YheS n=1 Tax=Cupriavidus taiwanensis TaxID=164546 RepID=A0A7Z7JAD3_9BURK|nr:putative ABC transporter, atp_binding component [Cupriavidus taiwanensis]SOZ05575.1 putative ABC transporter, atp_binding component [Cupriavidus taiwanensis]SOZ07559.1 putative ABC transporter, atp_binding component [Cupriavidus taiwanensis]SPC15597.1 putative ABC transporter, atp_binding component [Cupriavidus taiwanensis]SPD40245.1 fused putative transporter subunits of ABC superfamily: ATP-binding components [Cupriavidus taiwanensis]